MTLDLARILATLTEQCRVDQGWEPLLFAGNRAADREALARLGYIGEIGFCHDAIHAQIAELVETRQPDRKFTEADLALEVTRHLAGTPVHEYGTWVFYPWSKRLVHVLAEPEYVELRTSRNRNKITNDEQLKLGAMRVGIVGLSVGQATAVTLALEGVGGEFRLADFDALNLSNMNRLRTGAHSIGMNKAVVTAREIFEINPYARVRLFSEGISEQNVEAFLTEGGMLDLLFEECDDLKMKVRLREHARARKIPVLMETSDRGLLDVERFDREPERPLFHGLTGELRAEQLHGMTTYEKVPIVLKIIGRDTMSPRMAASLIDVEATLKTWPQLASAVALGGALNTDTARRIALGRFTDSGRYYVDIESIVRDGVAGPAIALESDVSTGRPDPPVPPPPLVRTTGPLLPEHVRSLVAHAAMAPSGGNCQPWRFAFQRGRLACIHDVERSRTFLDWDHGASYLAIGAAAENIALIAAEMGLAARVQAFPVAADPTLVCEIEFTPQDNAPGRHPELARQVARRVTNRRLGVRVPLDETNARAMLEIATAGGARLHLLRTDAQLAAIAEVLGRGDRIRFLSEVMHREMMNELRWTAQQTRASRDGLDIDTLELTPSDLAGMGLISQWPLMETIREVGGGAGLERSTRKAVAASSAIGLVSIAGLGPDSQFRGGRALQRVWLTATAGGLAFQPLSAVLYMFARLERGAGAGFSETERAELADLRARYRRLFDVPADHTELLLFRLAKANDPTARSLRRNVDDILVIDK